MCSLKSNLFHLVQSSYNKLWFNRPKLDSFLIIATFISSHLTRLFYYWSYAQSTRCWHLGSFPNTLDIHRYFPKNVCASKCWPKLKRALHCIMSFLAVAKHDAPFRANQLPPQATSGWFGVQVTCRSPSTEAEQQRHLCSLEEALRNGMEGSPGTGQF